MSTDVDESRVANPPVHISLVLGEGGDLWIAEDEDTGVASQGETRGEALENLDEAVALYHGDVGREPTEEELRELGIDPDDNTSGELPDVLQ